MNKEILAFLRRLRDELCPNGMVSLQVGGIGNLSDTTHKEARITFIEEVHQYVTLTDDELDNPDKLFAEIVEMIQQQRLEFP